MSRFHNLCADPQGNSLVLCFLFCAPVYRLLHLWLASWVAQRPAVVKQYNLCIIAAAHNNSEHVVPWVTLHCLQLAPAVSTCTVVQAPQQDGALQGIHQAVHHLIAAWQRKPAAVLSHGNTQCSTSIEQKRCSASQFSKKQQLLVNRGQQQCSKS